GSRDHLEVHHIRQRKDGGSNSPDNLITLCHGCHRAWHEGKKDMVTLSADPGFKAATEMSTMRWILLARVRKAHPDIPVEETYGYATNHVRKSLGLEKRHFIDARVISGNATAKGDGILWHIVAGRSHNRKIHKDTILENGVRKANQAARKVAGYGLGDKVMYAGQLCYIHGRRSSGYFDIRRLDGTRVHAGIHYRHLTLVERANTNLIYKELVEVPPSGRA
ncbi:MAG: HNH endonuclease, partial [Spirochaetes bacterium]|nr:HNH endonuclease [Candidatus Aphodenecus pullistercoris]